MKNSRRVSKHALKTVILSVLIGLMLPVSYSYPANDKSMLDENVRDIKTPQENKTFELLQEKRFRLNFTTTETYDSNIFLTPDNTHYDYITDIAPSAAATFGNSNYLFFASYTADMLIYAINNSETRLNQVVEGRAELFRNGKVKLTVRDTFRPTSDPATSETNNFVKRINNDLEVSAMYDISEKTSLGLDYEQVLQNYISSAYTAYSYLSNIISPTIYWHISPKTSITAEYDLSVFSYYEGTDYDAVAQSALLGMQGILTPKSSIYMKAGYEYKQYQSSNIKNPQGPILEGIYDYALSPKTALEFIASKQFAESIYSNEAYFDSINLYASAKNLITNTLSLNLAGYYLMSDYPHETWGTTNNIAKRFDNTLGGSVKLQYQPRNWALVFIGYEYRVRDSNLRDFNFTDSRVSCGGRVDF